MTDRIMTGESYKRDSAVRQSAEESARGNKEVTKQRKHNVSEARLQSTIDFEARLTALDSRMPGIARPANHGISKLMSREYAQSIVNDIPDHLNLSPEAFEKKRAFYEEKIQREQTVVQELFEQYNQASAEYKTHVKEFSALFNAQKKEINKKYASARDKHPVDSVNDKTAGEVNDKVVLHSSSGQGKIDSLTSDMGVKLQQIEKASNDVHTCYKAITNDCSAGVVDTFVQSEPHTDQLCSMGKFIAIMLEYMKFMNEDGIEAIKGHGQLNKIINEARLEDYKAKAKEAEDKAASANLLTKILSIIGAVVGIVLAVISVIAAIPSAGASLGATVALIVGITGLVVSVADTIVTFTADFSFMGTAFEKIIEGLTYVFEHSLGLLVAEIAEKCGADKDTVDDIKKYFSMACAYITLVALIVVPLLLTGGGSGAGSAASSVAKEAATTATKEVAIEMTEVATTTAVKQAAETVVEEVAETVIKETVTEAVEETAKTVVKEAVTEAVTKSASAISKVPSVLFKAEIVFLITSALATVGLNVAEGIYTKESMDALAELGITKKEIDGLQQMRRQQAQESKTVTETYKELVGLLTDAMQERTETMNYGYTHLQRSSRA